MTEPVILAGSQGELVVEALGIQGLPALVERFPDGEVHVQLRYDVGRRDVYIVQSINGGDAALELLLLADAAWRAGASRVSAVIPYFAYARQDRRIHDGQPLGAKVMARLVDGGHFDRVVVVDLHSAVVAGCFETPLDHLTAVPLIIDALRPIVGRDGVVVSPDLGAVKLAERYANELDLPLAVVHKTRSSSTVEIPAGEVTAHGLVGDVAGRSPVIIDDMISTGATIVAATQALRARGCVRRPIVAATHGLLVGAAAERLRKLDLEALIITDSLSLGARDLSRLPLHIVGLAPLLARAINLLHRRDAVGDLLSHV